MEQLTLFPSPYKYLIDSSSILAQKPTDKLPRKVHTSLWKKIDYYISEHIIVTCSEIEDEVKRDNTVGNYLSSNLCKIIQIDNEIQHNVKKIVIEHP